MQSKRKKARKKKHRQKESNLVFSSAFFLHQQLSFDLIPEPCHFAILTPCGGFETLDRWTTVAQQKKYAEKRIGSTVFQ